MTATWTDPDGLDWPLTVTDFDPGWFTTFGPAGWGSTPIEMVTDPNPRGGELVRYIRSQSRRIQWPLYIGGYDHMDFVNNYRNIMKAFTKTTYRRTAGVLTVGRPDGTRRVIEAYYEAGFEGEAGENWIWAKPVITLFCPDGYWADADLVGMDRGVEGGGGTGGSGGGGLDTDVPFLSPFVTVSKSAIIDDGGLGDGRTTSVWNNGDVDAWPTWIIQGPFSTFTATNVTTGGRFALTYPVLAGNKVVITTDPPTVRWFNTLDPNATVSTNISKHIDWFNTAGTSLWPLIPGENKIDFQVGGVGTGTSLSVVWRNRYESA